MPGMWLRGAGEDYNLFDWTANESFILELCVLTGALISCCEFSLSLMPLPRERWRD